VQACFDIEASVDKLIDIRLREMASALGAGHGLKYAEVFHYVPIDTEGDRA